MWHCYSALYSAVLCDSILSVMAVQCGTVTVRCTVLYCVTMCILVFGFECVTYSNVFMEGTDRQVGLW